MDVKKEKEILENENGQALIEFLIFLPFMLMMYSVSMSISNSINASINQQKITRSYFYYRLGNNSNFPRPRRGDVEPSDSWRIFGMQINGWTEKLFNNELPVAPCFKFVLPLGEDAEDECEESYTGNSTQFIRVKTVYGICGATYVKSNGYPIAYPRGASVPGSGDIQHCRIIE